MTRCNGAYHRRCFVAGQPFTCRRFNKSGLYFPPEVVWPVFICECCTVRRVIGRELGQQGDLHLLRLERMRLLDLANAWSKNTHAAYRVKLSFLARLESGHPGLQLLRKPTMKRPPVSPSLPLAWAELAYSTRRVPATNLPVSYGTVRQIRSAYTWYHTTLKLLEEAPQVWYNEKERKLTDVGVEPGQDAMMLLTTRGLQARIGTDSTPSKPLLNRHVLAVSDWCEAQFVRSVEGPVRHQWALAGLANLLFWLGWLRSSEVFTLRWTDVTCVLPEDGPELDLPVGQGCLLLRLNPETKTNRASTTTLPLAYLTRSGHAVGKWYRRALRTRPPGRETDWIFLSPTRGQWTSAYYRTGFLYPVLQSCIAAGDRYLNPHQEYGGGSPIAQLFYSMHCYRRGSRRHCEIVREGDSKRRKATPTEVYEHARWRLARAALPIDAVYREWTLWDRLQITLCCM